MAHTRKQTTKDGKEYYRIYVSRGKGKSPYTMNWYPSEGWSKRYTERELDKVACRFEEQCKNGEVQTRAERKEIEAREAEQKRIEEERARLEAEKIKTVEEYGEQVFIPTKAIECKPNTKAFYQFMLDGHIYPAIGSKKLGEVIPNDITKIILKMRANGLSHSTIKSVYITISQLFEMAYREDLIPCNPCDKVKRPKQTTKDGKDNEVKAFTPEELKYILKCLEQEPIKWRCLVRLLIDTGIRRGEACGLKWNCVNLKDGSIRIENNLCYTSEAGIFDEKPKNGKSRTIYISPAMIALLKEYRASLTKLSLRGYVFTQEDGYSPMHPTTPTKYLKKFGEQYNIEDCHPHKLRHSFATIAITNGADIASISELLGHSNTSVTLDVYTHANEAAQRKASEVFHKAMALEGHIIKG